MSNKGETQRQKKISSLLQKEIAKLIQNQLRNNGIKNLIISVTKVKVSVDLDSIPYLEGSTLDYSDNLNDSGFKLLNPNASRSCGCGTSFEPTKNTN